MEEQIVVNQSPEGGQEQLHEWMGWRVLTFAWARAFLQRGDSTAGWEGMLCYGTVFYDMLCQEVTSTNKFQLS